MVVNETMYVLAVWFVPFKDPTRGNWLCTVYRHKDDRRFRLQHRFYYEDDGKKVIFDARFGQERSEGDIIEQMGDAARAIAKYGGLDQVDCVIVRGNDSVLAEALMGKPWARFSSNSNVAA